jgi:hypothetical protein
VPVPGTYQVGFPVRWGFAVSLAFGCCCTDCSLLSAAWECALAGSSGCQGRGARVVSGTNIPAICRAAPGPRASHRAGQSRAPAHPRQPLHGVGFGCLGAPPRQRHGACKAQGRIACRSCRRAGELRGWGSTTRVLWGGVHLKQAIASSLFQCLARTSAQPTRTRAFPNS